MRKISSVVVSTLGVAAALAYGGCSSDEAPASGGDAGTVTEAGVDGRGPGSADACTSTQVPTDYDKCFKYDTFPLAGPEVTTACLPSALAAERAVGADFFALEQGSVWTLKEAYDPSPSCAKGRVVKESMRYAFLYLELATEYGGGTKGKTTAKFGRLPPRGPSPSDAGAEAGPPAEAGAPPPADITTGPIVCPPSWPQLECVDVKTWFQGGFFTLSDKELRLFTNADGTPDAKTATLYAVYARVP